MMFFAFKRLKCACIALLQSVSFVFEKKTSSNMCFPRCDAEHWDVMRRKPSSVFCFRRRFPMGGKCMSGATACLGERSLPGVTPGYSDCVLL